MRKSCEGAVFYGTLDVRFEDREAPNIFDITAAYLNER
jgi:hypothetical protein